MKPSSRLRIAVVFDNLGPYHLARLSGAARFADIVAVEIVARSADYAWERSAVPDGLRHVPLTDQLTQKHDPGALKMLAEHKLAPLAPQLLAVPGWSSLASLTLMQWAASASIPLIVMTETNPWDFSRRPHLEFIKRRIVSHYAAALGTSDMHADYLVELGLPREAIFFGYNAVDNGYFEGAADRVRAAGAVPRLDGPPLPQSAFGRYFLASNRFIEKKNLIRLLRAYAAFRTSRADDPGDWPLVLLGDGDLRSTIEAERAALGLDAFVHLPGFRQYDELPAFYGSAGAFVHVSTTEQWGLVVNEAMASGLPVVVSKRCGCAGVLVRQGVNGVTIDPYDEASIAATLAHIADTPKRAEMGQASREIIADWGPDRFGRGLVRAAEYALSRPLPQPSVIDSLGLSLATHQMARNAR